ncbi:MAG: hypothetical protein IKY23_12870 [Lachnospiraceae bacterium]|nr:hypothetical protein [Lachnospiraceae bacterium]
MNIDLEMIELEPVGSETDKTGKRKKKRRRRKRRLAKNGNKVVAGGKSAAGGRKKKRGIGTILLRIFLLLLLLGGIVGGVLFFLHRSDKAQKEAAAMEQIQAPVKEETVVEKEPEVLPDISSAVLGHIVTAGEMVDKVYKQRPPSVDLTEAEAAEFGDITSCVIEDGSRVSVTMEVDGLPVSDDKFYYLFDMNTYETTLEGKEPLDKVYKDRVMTFSAPLNYNSSSSRLFKKFTVAIKKDDKYIRVCRPHFITNPEAIARYSSYQTPASKKGLLVDPNKLRGSELDDLGVKQAAYNIPLGRLLGPTSNPAWPTIHYTYNGRTYTINGQVVAEYDLIFGTLTNKGICTTAIILNNFSGYTQLIHPQSRSGSTAPYAMFNATDSDGVEIIAALGTFLAERYSSNAHGKVSNWIIANEINARKEWNYMAHTDVNTYVDEYAKSFRVFYNAIKSVNAAARVYMPIDQQWDRNLKNNPNYDGRDVIDVFNRTISMRGNIDWGLAQHPYNVPLYETRIWKGTKYVNNSVSTSMITMDNISVLTNYMQQESLLSPAGGVRSILLSEQGYSSTAGEAVQAAAFAYAYYKTENNPHIDGFLLNRQTDAPEEVAQGLAFGLNHSNGAHKYIYNVFKYIDTPQHADYTNFAKDIIGISRWSQIMD